MNSSARSSTEARASERGGQMNERILSMLGLARRAGRLSAGFDAVTESLQRGRAQLVLIASDISDRSRGNICRTAEGAGCPVIILDIPQSAVGAAIGKKSGIVSVDDGGFAKKIQTLCNE